MNRTGIIQKYILSQSIWERNIYLVGPAHVGTLNKDGTEVLNLTKIVVIYAFVLFQSSCNLELQVLQILKHAHKHTQA